MAHNLINYDDFFFNMKYKLIAFDLDGTLIEGLEFSWKLIHDKLKVDQKKRDEMKEKYFSGKASYQEWAIHDVMMWKELGATKQNLIEAISGLNVMPGAHELLFELKKRGLIVGVISGSLNFILDEIFPKHPFDFVYLNEVIFDKEGYINECKPTYFDFNKKADALIMECKECGIDLKETIFVGDHDNDVQAAKVAGLSIAFNCNSDKLRKVVDYEIKEKNLMQVLDMIK